MKKTQLNLVKIEGVKVFFVILYFLLFNGGFLIVINCGPKAPRRAQRAPHLSTGTRRRMAIGHLNHIVH